MRKADITSKYGATVKLQARMHSQLRIQCRQRNYIVDAHIMYDIISHYRVACSHSL